MTERENTAIGYHTQGYNCCQSVLRALCDKTGIDAETSAALGCGFARGMYTGNICGALTGALMAIGAACERGMGAMEARPVSEKLTAEVEQRFQQRFGTLLCEKLLEPEGKTICNSCIAFAVNAAEEIINQYKSENK